jgi:hypothetical protein
MHCKVEFQNPLDQRGRRPRLTGMATSTPFESEREELRPFQTKLYQATIDELRHLAIDRRVSVWQIVEEALREKFERERASAETPGAPR